MLLLMARDGGEADEVRGEKRWCWEGSRWIWMTGGGEGVWRVGRGWALLGLWRRWRFGI